VIYVVPASTFETVAQGFATGLTGTIGVKLIDNTGAVTIARTTSGISEVTDSPGVYTTTLTAPTTAGQYTVIWDDGSDTESGQATEDVTVTASAQIVLAAAGDYITEEQLKSARGMTNYTFADGEIPTAITTASRTVDKLCGRYRRFWLDDDAEQVRVYTALDDCRVVIDDLAELTTVKTDQNGDGVYETTWTAGRDFTLTPLNADSDNRPWEMLKRRELGRYVFPCWEAGVQVTGRFGWPEVPSEVVTATLLLASRYLMRARESTFGILAVGGPVEGTMMRIARTDPDIPGLLEGLSRRAMML
jgi:hypothetical protein